MDVTKIRDFFISTFNFNYFNFALTAGLRLGFFPKLLTLVPSKVLAGSIPTRFFNGLIYSPDAADCRLMPIEIIAFIVNFLAFEVVYSQSTLHPIQNRETLILGTLIGL